MKTTNLASLLAIAAAVFCSSSALAQENWTEGPVWGCTSYQTAPGQFQNYIKWLRSNFLPIATEEKKQGLILDSKIFIQAPHDANDWDVMVCRLHANFGKALDYNKAEDDKIKAIQANQWKTPDQQRQQELAKPRLEMRRFLGTSYVREVNLRPMP
jgi:hypothetical protein